MHKNLFKCNNFRQVVAMDETSLFADNLANTTIAKKGSKEVMLRSTGHEKLFQTAVLSINMDGSKNTPFIVFKGKGTSRSAEVKQLREREDIVTVWSDNGWMNSVLVCQWLEGIFTEENISEPALLVWD